MGQWKEFDFANRVRGVLTEIAPGSPAKPTPEQREALMQRVLKLHMHMEVARLERERPRS